MLLYQTTASCCELEIIEKGLNIKVILASEATETEGYLHLRGILDVTNNSQQRITFEPERLLLFDGDLVSRTRFDTTSGMSLVSNEIQPGQRVEFSSRWTKRVRTYNCENMQLHWVGR